MSRQPPALAVRLLRAAVGATAFDVIAGDLAEEFSYGRSRAWYWRQTFRSIGAHWFGMVPITWEVAGASVRQLRRQPIYVAGVAGTLALAIATAAASTAIIKRAFLDGLPFPAADRLGVLTTDDTAAVSVHVLRDLEASAGPFDRFAPIRPITITLATSESTSTVNGMLVTPDYFSVLGTRPAIGGIWNAADEPAVIVSWPFFERELGADPASVGRPITIDGIPRTVLGVMPSGFVSPFWPEHELWLPLNLQALNSEPRGRRQLTIIARRSDTVSTEAADAFLAALTSRLRIEYPVEHGRQTWRVRMLRDDITGSSRPALIGIAAGAILLVFIVCANIGGLATARASSMRHQIAVRQALGGSRGRLFAEQLADAVSVAALGVAIGLAVAPLFVSVAARYQREFLDRMTPISLDATVAIVVGAVGLIAGALAALLPLRMVGRGALAGIGHSVRGVSAGRRLTLVRQTLVVAQVALALVLVVGAGLLVRTVRHLSELSLGFNTEGMTTMAVTMPGKRFASQAEQIRLEEEILTRLRALPGVSSATASVGIPAGRAMGASLHIRGRSTAEGLQEVGYNSIAPGFREAMGMSLKAGRDITLDDRAGGTGAILVNETMARLHWPAGDAIGARIYLGPGAPDPGNWMEIVGIVGDVHPFAPGDRVTPSAYGSTRQYSWARRFFTVHTTHKPDALEAGMRAAVRAADPSVSVGVLRALPEFVDATRGRHRLVMTALLIFAGVALVLCAAGLYAVSAMLSGMRRREYAIRVALGAPRDHVRWHVVRQALVLAAAGIAAGIAIAAGAVGTIQGMVHGVAMMDPATFIGAAVLLAAVAGAAAFWPAHKAARVDPVETLKAE